MSRALKRYIVVLALLLAALLSAIAYIMVSGYIARKLHPVHYAELVSESAAEFGVPRSVIFAVIRTESSFRPDAVSRVGATGLVQLMPDTFNWLLSKTGESYTLEDLWDPAVNIRYGTMLLAVLYEEFGQWNTAYAAYNAGLNRVRLWLADPDVSQDGELVAIPYPETENYVKKVVKAAAEYRRLYDIE